MLHQSWLILSESESGDLCSQADDDDKDCSGDDDDVDNPHPDWKGALQYPQIYQVDRKCSPADRALLFLHPLFQISALSIVEMKTLKEKKTK